MEEKKAFTLELALEGRGSFSASGPEDVVFRALKEFREEIARGPAASTGERRREDPNRPATEGSGTRSQQGSTQVVDGLPPLGPFLRAKAPANYAEAVAVMAVWDKRKNRAAEVTIESMKKLWSASGRRAASNLARDIQTAAQQGWLEKADRGKYTVPAFGENFVDELPVKGKEK